MSTGTEDHTEPPETVASLLERQKQLTAQIEAAKKAEQVVACRFGRSEVQRGESRAEHTVGISEQVFQYMIEAKTGYSIEQLAKSNWQARCGNIYSAGHATPQEAVVGLNVAAAARLAGDTHAGRV